MSASQSIGVNSSKHFSMCITPTFHPRSEDLVELSLSRCERERGNKGKSKTETEKHIDLTDTNASTIISHTHTHGFGVYSVTQTHKQIGI